MISHAQHTTITIITYDRDMVKVDSYTKPIDSFVSNWIVLQYALMVGGTGCTVTLVDGSDSASPFNLAGIRTLRQLEYMDAGYGDSFVGIVIGSSSVAPSAADYQLGGRYVHTPNTGVVYGGQWYTYASDSIGTTRTVSRLFTNDGSSSLPIREIGIYMKVSAVNDSLCVLRDSVSFDMSPGYSTEILYSFSTVASGS